MPHFIIEQSKADLTTHSGLALVGPALNEYTDLAKSVKQAIMQRHGIAHADVLKSYIDLLCLGKSDFEAVSGVRGDEFFRAVLGIGVVTSTEPLRQRLDRHAHAFLPLLVESGSEFLVNVGAQCKALDTGHVPLDADVTPFDNA